MSPLATLAALADRLGNCPRAPGPCDCLICAADAAIERQWQPLFQQAIRKIGPAHWQPGRWEQP